MKYGISGYLAFLFFFFPLASFSQEGAIKLAEGVYAIKGPRSAINTGESGWVCVSYPLVSN